MSLSIAIISDQVAPFSKAGGLGDVAAALPKHLSRFGHRIVVVTPYYGFINHQNLKKELIGEATVSIGKTSYQVKFLRTMLTPDIDVPLYFIYQEELFNNRQKIYGFEDDNLRFALFDRSVFALFDVLGYAPDILHCHDWSTGLIPDLLRREFSQHLRWKKTSTVFTIHNQLYQMQGMWFNVPPNQRDHGLAKIPTTPAALRHTNFSLRGIKYADAINTVSLRYAEELLTKKFGEGLDGLLRRRQDRFFGIINGIDYGILNPQFDKNLKIHYDWNSLNKKLQNKLAFQKELGLEVGERIPLIGMANRLTEQKGFDLIIDIVPILLRLGVQFVVVGDGDKSYVKFFRQQAKQHPSQVAVPMVFSEAMESKVYASSDMFLMPSRFEPCGIAQLKSLRYGSIPIVHKTGGLADTISDFDPTTGAGTGFVFPAYYSTDLLVALTRAVETFKYPRVWEHLTWQAMKQSFSWDLPTQKYVELYKKAIKFHAVG